MRIIRAGGRTRASASGATGQGRSAERSARFGAWLGLSLPIVALATLTACSTVNPDVIAKANSAGPAPKAENSFELSAPPHDGAMSGFKFVHGRVVPEPPLRLGDPNLGRKSVRGTDPIVLKFRQKLASMSGGTLNSFLRQLVPIHVEWHASGSFAGEPIGFLTFHHELLAAYEALRHREGKSPVQRLNMQKAGLEGHFDESDLAQESSPRFVAMILNVGPHSLAHSKLEIMNHATGIFSEPFWEIHRYMDEVFERWLKEHGMTYEDVDHRWV